MKTRYIFIAIGALALLGACQKDPWAAVEEGSWNNDHRILEIKFAGQAGTATLKDIDATTGTISFQLATDLVSDMSRVTVEKLDLSFKATSDVKRGETLDFTGAAPTIKVTSETGLSRVYTINMTPFAETLIGKYSITSSKVWGGTGPEWGGGAIVSPENKSWCWYVDEGFGPAAEYDDYLEFTLGEILPDGNTTGKCIHYGGVDGKHWNCMFKAAMNKEGTTDIDLHKFYRQIPVGESTWKRDYKEGTISFTDSRGYVTTGRLVPPDTYGFDFTNDQGKTYHYEIVLDTQAFQFNLSGVDDWTNIYTDYDKFVKRPRMFAVLVNKVDDIPSASKTEGTEGDTTIGPDPDPDPDPEAFDLSGDWKVKELWVYGGSEGKITKDQAASKPWSWNGCNGDKTWSYCNYEMDNLLTITPSEAGSLSGSLLYGPGADGLYWDYLYTGNKAGAPVSVDCSQWYGWLPHEQTTYTYNPNDTALSPAGTVTVKKSDTESYTAFLLLEGSYELLEKSALVISSDCFALALQLAEAPSQDTSYEWTDYDRFVHSPLLYVMVFQKQAQ